jgi:hypothetical protein
MQSTKNKSFSVLQEGSLKEETWESEDLAAVCRAGRMSPNSLVFIPDEGGWKPLHETVFAEYFGVEQAAVSEATQNDEISARYTALLSELHDNPDDVDLTLHAGELALAGGDVEAATRHYQRALEINPYHPRVAQEAKRNLPATKWRTLRFLDKPPHVWEEPLALVAYPLSRGPVYFALPAAVVFGLSFTPWTLIPAVLALTLWAVEVIRASAAKEKTPPLWHGLAGDPVGRAVSPLVAAAAHMALVVAPFVAAAGVLVALGKGSGTDIASTLQKSPVMMVMVVTGAILYLPAAATVAASSKKRLLDAVNPLVVISAIRVMEVEYIAAVMFNVLLLVGTWTVGRLLEPIPVAGRVFFAVAAVYVVLAGGFVMGRVYARFAERLDCPRPDPGSSPE